MPYFTANPDFLAYPTRVQFETGEKYIANLVPIADALPPITAKYLENKAGINPGGSSQVIRAFHYINFVSKDGHITQDFKDLVSAEDEEQRIKVLQRLVKNAYQDVFKRIDLEHPTADQISHAFENYEPRTQKPRLMNFFIYLCDRAKIFPATAVAKSTPGSNDINIQPSYPPIENPQQPLRDTPMTILQEKLPTQVSTHPAHAVAHNVLDMLLQDVWTEAQRDELIASLSAMVKALSRTKKEGT